MKNVFAFAKYLPKRFLGALLVLAIALMPVLNSSAALPGADRPMKEYQGPGTPGFDYPVFNSFTNVPNIGDERDFYHGKIAGADGGFYDPVTVTSGDEALVRIYVHNGADPKHNASGQGVAKDVKVRASLPNEFDKEQVSTAYIESSNAQPKLIADTLTFKSAQDFSLEYIPGSATLKSNFIDTPLSDSIVTSGVQIGDKALNGQVDGCFEFVALVTFKVKVKTGNIDVQKTVRKLGDNGEWKDKVSGLKLGDKVEYRIRVENTGSVDIKDMTVGDNLPPLMNYVNDTATVYNTNYPQGRKIGNNLTTGGTILGETYTPGSVAYILFQAQVAAETDRCGMLTLTNVGIAGSSVTPNREDDAVVEVDTNKPCEEELAFRCEGLSAVSVTDREFKFTATPGLEGNVEVKQYLFNFGDGQTATVGKETNGVVNHTYAAPGTYKTSVKIVTTEGTTKEVCEVSVTIPTTPGQRPTDKLPNTGIGSILGGVFGTSAIGATVSNWFRSKRALKAALLKG